MLQNRSIIAVMGGMDQNRSDDGSALVANISGLLEFRELTRADLYRRTGMARSTLYDKLDNPDRFTVADLGRIAAVLGTSIKELVTGT